MTAPDPHQIYPERNDRRRSWPGLVILLALIVAGALLLCVAVWPWG